MYLQTVTLVITLCYMIGSFPTAYLIGKLNGVNIFELGSGNMGTTNVLRTLGTYWGAVVFIEA
jgi:glycerol-3-phosphate acyltransferase PlsY